MRTRTRTRRRGIGPIAVAVILATGCGAHGPRSPQALRDAYADALRKNDPAAAYALLAPEVQARVPFEEFERRWRENEAERKQQLAAMERLPGREAVAREDAVTTHEGDRVLHWTRVGKRHLVVAGLPGVPRTDTPAAAVRALVAALRDGDLGELRGIASTDLMDRMREDWTARADAIERALQEPDGLELSGDGQRAELRYGDAEAIRLEQTPGGWRVVSLE